MNFKNKLKSIFSKTGLLEKARTQSLTSQDWAIIRAEYKREFGTELGDDQSANAEDEQNSDADNQRTQQIEAENAAALAMINDALGTDDGDGAGDGDGSDNGEDGEPNTAGQASSSNGELLAATGRLINAMATLERSMIPDTPKTVNGVRFNVNGQGTTKSHFLGIPHSMFSMDRRWNQVAVNPAYATIKPVSERTDGEAFRAELQQYASSVAARINELRSNPALRTSAESIVTLNGNAGLGDQYVVIRIDQLIARINEAKNVYDIFPRRFGIQDREVMTNAYFGDFSQAYQEGGVFKGSVTLAPEMCYVDDAMMKTLFKSMKWLEREYIGYLNKEGSDPIKWSMIEWALLFIGKKLIEEQNKRKIFGIYMKPETNKPGHYLNAGTGVYYTLLRYYNECKLSLMDNVAYSSYSSGSTMVGVVSAMALELSQNIEDIDQYEVILNANHKMMWKAGIRDVYGKDTDFTGPNGDFIPDTNIPIRWCYYWGQLPIVIFQIPGNIQSLEFIAGEMHALSFETEMENVRVWSNWKEGTSAAYAGKIFATKALRLANGLADQQIFVNRPSVTLSDDATTVTANGDIRHYITCANTTQGKEITNIANAKEGVAYMIEIGSATNPQKITKSGKFATIVSAFTPTLVGDYIIVAINSDGDKFVELERCVAGVREINKDIQPNVPGGR